MITARYDMCNPHLPTQSFYCSCRIKSLALSYDHHALSELVRDRHCLCWTVGSGHRHNRRPGCCLNGRLRCSLHLNVSSLMTMTRWTFWGPILWRYHWSHRKQACRPWRWTCNRWLNSHVHKMFAHRAQFWHPMSIWFYRHLQWPINSNMA